MESEYAPTYATDHILIKFKREFSEEFVQEYLKAYGYKLHEEKSHHDWYHLKIPLEKFEKTKQKFYHKPHNKFIDWVEKRDLKWEQRIENLENIIEKVAELRDEPNIPNKEYEQKLKQITKYINTIKKD